MDSLVINPLVGKDNIVDEITNNKINRLKVGTKIANCKS